MSSRPEVEWDETEQAWMHALTTYRRDLLCPCGCGWPAEVTLDPMTEFRLDVPTSPRVCQVTKRLGAVQDAWAKRDGATRHGLLWSVNLRD